MFKLSPELDELRAEVRKTATRAFGPKAAYWDEHAEFPHENQKILADLGYLGLLLPEQYGGLGQPLIHGLVTVEELARVDPATAIAAQMYLHNVPNHIAAKGTEAQKEKYLPALAKGEMLFVISMSEPQAGSALTDLKTSAEIVGDEVILNGSKCYCTGGNVATHAMVFVRFGNCKGAKGIGAVIVEKGAPGFEIGKPHPKMGARGVGETDLFFSDCRVPVENIFVKGDPDNTQGFKTLMGCFGMERLGVAAMCVGIADAAFDYAKKFSEERQQFGRPICEFQGLQWKIADMAIQIHAARLMTYRAGTNLGENGLPDPMEAAMAKVFANEMVLRVVNEAMQICGHFGYTTQAPLERMYRDARNYSYAAGTPELLRNTVASIVYERAFDQRRN